MLNENVYWVLELALQTGRLDDFQSLMHEMVEAVGLESGTLNYEWHISGDGGISHIYVRYFDSAAVMAHMAGWESKFSGRFDALATITRMTVYGSPNAGVKAALAPYGPVYLEPLGGFKR